jgi:hypothetical protein
MGFGFYQARASGLGGVRADRSPNQVNRYISESKAARKLREEVESDCAWGPFVDHWIRDGMSAEVTQDALCRARTFMRMKAKGFSLKWRMRFIW